MGPKPSSLHGREVEWEGFGGAVGPPGQLDIWVQSERRWGVDGRGWESEKEDQKKETDGGERTRESDKGRKR